MLLQLLIKPYQVVAALALIIKAIKHRFVK